MAKRRSAAPSDARQQIHQLTKRLQDYKHRIEKLEELYISKEIARARDLSTLATRLHKLEQVHMARDDRELANYTRQVGAIDAKVNGMADNLHAYDRRIVECEQIVANSPTQAFTRLAERVLRIERQNRDTARAGRRLAVRRP